MKLERIGAIIEKGVLTLLIVGALIYGFLGRISHTNLFRDDLEHVQVAELYSDQEFIQNLTTFMEKALPTAPNIIKCEVLEEPELIYGTMRVRVRVLKVFQGTDIQEHDEIYITKGSWGMSIAENGTAQLDLGFHNLMQVGKEYLIFLDERLDLPEVKYGVVYPLLDHIIAPIFLYGDCTNVCVPVGKDNTYVPYSEVADNEFFFVSEDDLELLLQLKEKLIKKYQ